MKLSYQDIQIVNSAYEQIPFKGLAILTSSENLVLLSPHLTALATTRTKLIEQYGKGGAISATDKNWPAFLGALDKVLTKQVEVEGLEKIKLDGVDFERKTANNWQSHLAALRIHGLVEK